MKNFLNLDIGIDTQKQMSASGHGSRNFNFCYSYQKCIFEKTWTSTAVTPAVYFVCNKVTMKN